jgi:carbamoyl-phosphate synthase large subunit
VLVPTLAEELVHLDAARDALRAAGLAAWLPDPDAVATCIDKWRFAQAMSAAGLPSPPTALGEVGEVPGPWIVKPRFGRGSRDVVAVDDTDELAWALRRVPKPIVQHRLDGREFTVDVLAGRDGRVAGAVPRWRLETRGGISTRGETFIDAALDELVERAVAALGLTGPANIQGFRTSGGGFAVTETNPRFSGGLPLSLAAGADLVGEYLHMVGGGEPRAERLRYRPGVTMMRYFEEVFEE